ncbi:MAG: methyltransferase domain-containing protein [Methylotenera sp.]|nr:methyltransferase domain-containing protein [Methylotenera sp.]
MMTSKKNIHFSYDEHARKCAPDDFSGQTRRTVQGVPVPAEQIQMIVDAIKLGLDFDEDDALVELACGNGSLSQFLFLSCKKYQGVDVSEYLISIAKKNFELLPNYRFQECGAIEYLQNEKEPQKFTKLLCYAGIQYFKDDELVSMLSLVTEKFINIKTIFIGSIPDKSRAEQFYKDHTPTSEELSDSNTALGVWRNQQEFESLANMAGWTAKFSNMPTSFYASYYRYDVVLSRVNLR